MRPPADYVALRDIKIPDSYAYAARQGDDVNDMQRVNLNLVVGVDISPLRPEAMARPADDADRGEWQDYAVVRGVPYAEAVNLDRAELAQRLETQDEPETANAGDQPAEADRKARWVEYAVVQIVAGSSGRVTAELARERAEARTKAELIEAFGPDGDGTGERFADLFAEPDPAQG